MERKYMFYLMFEGIFLDELDMPLTHHGKQNVEAMQRDLEAEADKLAQIATIHVSQSNHRLTQAFTSLQNQILSRVALLSEYAANAMEKPLYPSLRSTDWARINEEILFFQYESWQVCTTLDVGENIDCSWVSIGFHGEIKTLPLNSPRILYADELDFLLKNDFFRNLWISAAARNDSDMIDPISAMFENYSIEVS